MKRLHRKFSETFLTRQYLTFLVVGGSGVAVNLSMTYALTEWAGIFYLGSYVISTLVSWTFMFQVHSGITFKGHGVTETKKAYVLFIGMYVLVVLVNWISVWAMTSIVGLHYMASIIFVTGGISILSFLGNRLFIFKAVEQ